MEQKSVMPQKPSLDYYKELYKRYEIIIDEKKNYIGVFNRQDAKHENEYDTNKYSQLYLDMMFAKSWINACGQGITYTDLGSVNAYGVNPTNWEYAFNDGAHAVYGVLLDNIDIINGLDVNSRQFYQNLDYMLKGVEEITKYKYAGNIMEGLFCTPSALITQNAIKTFRDNSKIQVHLK